MTRYGNYFYLFPSIGTLWMVLEYSCIFLHVCHLGHCFEVIVLVISSWSIFQSKMENIVNKGSQEVLTTVGAESRNEQGCEDDLSLTLFILSKTEKLDVGVALTAMERS